MVMFILREMCFHMMMMKKWKLTLVKHHFSLIMVSTMRAMTRISRSISINKTLEGYLIANVVNGMRAGFRGKLNNLMVQLRKNCNHPDLLESQFDGSFFFPPVEQIVGLRGKFQLFDKLVGKLLDRKHKIRTAKMF
ncbi:unnamed protein product [Cuscuta campestris]|uniref:SNF2 N-terminal domain-containing protein n=1 Tax=Cuscuta campestris TaxID=132261 RepID=A0A484KV45_9ASTE|nr:unnamed protein product [Cuscuta campestris]